MKTHDQKTNIALLSCAILMSVMTLDAMAASPKSTTQKGFSLSGIAGSIKSSLFGDKSTKPIPSAGSTINYPDIAISAPRPASKEAVKAGKRSAQMLTAIAEDVQSGNKLNIDRGRGGMWRRGAKYGFKEASTVRTDKWGNPTEVEIKYTNKEDLPPEYFRVKYDTSTKTFKQTPEVRGVYVDVIPGSPRKMAPTGKR